MGSNPQSGEDMSNRSIPRTSMRPAMTSSAVLKTEARASGVTRASAPSGRRAEKWGFRTGALGLGRDTGHAQAAFWIWSRARQAISAGDILASRRTYQLGLGTLARPQILTGAPVDRLCSAARVARVVATSEEIGTGIGPPVRTASIKASISARWPLSAAPSTLCVRAMRPDQTVAFLKLSRRATRPEEATSNVSFGKRALPLVKYVTVPSEPSGYLKLTCKLSRPASIAETSTGSAPSHHEIVSMKCPPSPANRDPSRSSLLYQLLCDSLPAFTR